MGVEPCPDLGAGSLELYGPHALLGHERRRVPRHVARRDRPAARGARRHARGGRARARPRSAARRGGRRGVRRPRAARPGAALRAGALVDGGRERAPAGCTRARRGRCGSCERRPRAIDRLRAGADDAGDLRRLPAAAGPVRRRRGSPTRSTRASRAEQLDPAFEDDADVGPAGAARALALGTVGVSLLRPMLVVWPASQVAAVDAEGRVEGGSRLGRAAAHGRRRHRPRPPARAGRLLRAVGQRVGGHLVPLGDVPAGAAQSLDGRAQRRALRGAPPRHARQLRRQAHT